jgi:VCBS repeat-containing protein
MTPPPLEIQIQRGSGRALTVSASDGVLANDTDPENDPLTAIKATDPTNGTLTLNSDGSFTYKPRAGFSGTDSFTYKANDGTNDSNVATVTLTVNPETTAPTVSSVTPTKTTGVSRTPNITATFSEPVDKATVEAIDPTTQKSVNVKLINPANSNQVAATVSCDADPCNKVTITPRMP